jgi:hypothetical protein
MAVLITNSYEKNTLIGFYGLTGIG